MGTLVYKASIHLDQREFPTLQRRDSYSEMLRLFLQIRTRSLPPRNPFSAVFKPRRRTSTSSSASSTPPSTPSASPTTSPVMAPSQGDPALANIPRNTNRRPLSGVSRENWDDDFDFGSDDERRDDETCRHAYDARDTSLAYLQPPQPGLASSASSVVENWDDELVAQPAFPKPPIVAPSSHDSRPSTAGSSSVMDFAQNGFVSRSITENWDDDFLDDGEDAPPHVTTPSGTKALDDGEQSENWDDDLEEPVAGPSTPRPQSTDLFTSALKDGGAHQVLDASPYIHSRLERYSLDESRSELGIFGRELEDEDKTLTRRRPRNISTTSPMPPIPRSLGHNSISPTISEFSVPQTVGESIYSYTGLLAYRSTPTISLYGAPAPESPPQRPRRRLKKKQRPGMTQLDDAPVRELQVEPEEPELARPVTPPPRPVTPEQRPVIIEPVSPASPGSRALLSLSRVSSMKKWRRSRASTGPSEVAINEEQRRPPTPPRPSWFMKSVGSPDLKKFKSRDQLTVDSATPRARAARSRSNTVGSMPPGFASVEKLTVDAHPRPLSMLPTSRIPSPLAPAAVIIPTAPTKTGSVKLQKVQPPPPAPTNSPQRSGYRSLMGGVRRISLLGKHKKTASKAAADVNSEGSPSEKENIPTQSQSSIADTPAAPPTELKPTIDTTNITRPIPIPPPNTLSPARHLSPTSESTSSPQSASLSRVTGLGNGTSPVAHRRTSLGDLKIPSRIKSAQMSIKRDLNMVKEFATCIDHIKNLQTNYIYLVATIDRGITENANRAGSPIRYHLPRPPSRSSKKADQVVLLNLKQIEDQYSHSWEIAEVLLKLSSNEPQDSGDNSFSSSIHGVAITTSEEASAPDTPCTPPSAYDRQSKWQGSTGRQSMTARELDIIRNILRTPSGGELHDLPEQSNGSLAPQYPAASTATLPSDGPDEMDIEPPSQPKKRRGSRLRGLKGFFTFGRSEETKRQTSVSPQHPGNSSASGLSDGHVFEADDADSQPHFLQAQLKEAMDIRRHPNSPYGTTTAPPTEIPTKSPRRPSLASIFRIGNKGNDVPRNASASAKTKSNGALGHDEDWDRMDMTSPSPSKSVLQHGRRISSDVQPKRHPSQGQLKHKRHISATHSSTRLGSASQLSLSNNNSNTNIKPSSSTRRPRSATSSAVQTGVSRSSSLRAAASPPPSNPMLNVDPDPRLIFSPENIQPLLTHARKVTMELDKCIQDLNALLPQVVTISAH